MLSQADVAIGQCAYEDREGVRCGLSPNHEVHQYRRGAGNEVHWWLCPHCKLNISTSEHFPHYDYSAVFGTEGTEYRQYTTNFDGSTKTDFRGGAI